MMLGARLGFLLALLVSVIGLVLRFAEPAATVAKRSRQTRMLVCVGLLALASPSISFFHAWRGHSASPGQAAAAPNVPANAYGQIFSIP